MSQQRGELTQRIKDKSIDLLGYEMDVVELRLMAYVQYLLTNSSKINIDKISGDELEIIVKWKNKGYIHLSDKMTVSKEFWDIICEIIYLGYIDLSE